MRTFKTLALGLTSALAIAAAAGSAHAADLGRGEYKEPVPVVDYTPPIMWSGLYIGANVGAGWDDSDEVEIADDAFLLGGGHLGFNWQTPSNLVVGIEGDVNFLEDVDYLATVRGRLGYAFGPTLLYATGGAAFIGFDEDFGDETDTGWVAGLGLERKWADNVSFGLEGLYYSFEGEDDVGDANFWAARARLTYHLGAW
jgi:outer membrane immunogenic protein